MRKEVGDNLKQSTTIMTRYVLFFKSTLDGKYTPVIVRNSLNKIKLAIKRYQDEMAKPFELRRSYVTKLTREHLDPADYKVKHFEREVTVKIIKEEWIDI